MVSSSRHRWDHFIGKSFGFLSFHSQSLLTILITLYLIFAKQPVSNRPAKRQLCCLRSILKKCSEPLSFLLFSPALLSCMHKSCPGVSRCKGCSKLRYPFENLIFKWKNNSTITEVPCVCFCKDIFEYNYSIVDIC